MPARSEATKIERFLSGRLPIGFYIYLSTWRQYSDPTAHDLDQAIEDLAKRGFTYLYVGGTTDSPLWTRVLALCEQYRIAVIPQLDFAYLARPEAKVEALVNLAVPFIRKYKDHPALMAFSICEEPGEKIMPTLQRYYEGILREVPDAPLQLIHSNLNSITQMIPPYPDTMGTDRYGFWWEMSGHRATPWYALTWYRTQLGIFYQQTVQRGADFQAVFTANTLESLITPERIKTAYYGEGAHGAQAAEAREDFLRRILGHAASGNLGWAHAQNGNLRYWKYYRPPVNCVRAMCWLGIMEGARSVASWSLSPPRADMKDFVYRTQGETGGKEYINSILGWEGTGTPQLDEFADFSRQIQRYARLIRVMSKEWTPRGNMALPKGHELVTGTEGATNIIEVEGGDAAWQSFSVPGFTGKIVVVVNTRVGTWCEGRSPRHLSPKDVFRIDDAGNAVDYSPAQEPRDITCRLLGKDVECFDLANGKLTTMDGEQRVAVPIAPGGGRILFLAPRGSTEGARLLQDFELY